MREAPRFRWVLTVASKTLAALDRGLAVVGQRTARTPATHTDNQNRS